MVLGVASRDDPEMYVMEEEQAFVRRGARNSTAYVNPKVVAGVFLCLGFFCLGAGVSPLFEQKIEQQVFHTIGGGASFTQSTPEKRSLRQLLSSQELHEVATDNVVKFAGEHIPENVTREDIRDMAKTEVFGKLLKDLENHGEDARELLDAPLYDEDVHAALLNRARYMLDPRVARLSAKVSEAVRDAPDDATPEEMEERIYQKMKPYQQEVERILLSSTSQRQINAWLANDFAQVTPRSKFDFSRDDALSTEEQQSSQQFLSRRLDISKGTLNKLLLTDDFLNMLATEARVILDDVRSINEAFCADLKINPMIVSLVGASNLLTQGTGCAIRAAEHKKKAAEACMASTGSPLYDASALLFKKFGIKGAGYHANGPGDKEENEPMCKDKWGNKGHKSKKDSWNEKKKDLDKTVDHAHNILHSIFTPKNDNNASEEGIPFSGDSR